MTSKKYFLYFRSIYFLLGLMLAWGASGQTLTIESWRKDDQLYWDKILIPAFRRLHPEIRVEFTPEEPLAYDSRVETRLATRRAGDLIFCRPFDGSLRLFARDSLRPLDEALLQPFSREARRAWTSEDGQTTYCLPVAYVIHALFYNRDIFSKHGLQPPQTLPEFMAMLKKLAKAGDTTPLALGTADMWEATQVLFTGLGPVFWGGEKGRIALLRRERRFTDPEFVAAWRFMAQLKPYMHPEQSTMGNQDMQLLFATGNAAIYPTGSWDIDFLRNTSFAYKKQINMGVFRPPVPHAGDRCQLSVHPDFGIGINRNSRNPEAARKFLQWLASAEFAQLLSDNLSGYFSLSDHPVQLKDPLSQEMVGWRKSCDQTIRLNAEKMNRVWPSMEEELWYINVKVVNQEISPEEAARHIQRVHERNTYLP